jgi:hypothetical protein
METVEGQRNDRVISGTESSTAYPLLASDSPCVVTGESPSGIKPDLD